jgi:putative transposase
MPYRREGFSVGNLYHVYNRGFEHQQLFKNDNDYQRFHDKLQSYVEKSDNLLHAYVLMPNHYHLLLEQGVNTPIEKMIGNLQNGYGKYFNLIHKEKGAVFDGRYKAKPIGPDDYLLFLSRYIHRNPMEAGLVKDIVLWKWSSYWSYSGDVKEPFVTINRILTFFKRNDPEADYRKYTNYPLDNDIDLYDIFIDSSRVVQPRG